MLRKISRWMRSKKGMYTLGGVIAVLLIVALLGQSLGWWQDIGLSGAAGGNGKKKTEVPPTEVPTEVPTEAPTPFPAPEGGQTCLPTCSEVDGRFMTMPSENMASFGGQKNTVWISVPSSFGSFTVDFFDGDAGKNTNNEPGDKAHGNWDSTITETTYTLYADPAKDGAGMTQVAQWFSQDMPNNAWISYEVGVGAEAQGESGHYFYRLEATRSAVGFGIQAFKVRSNAYLSAGMGDASGAAYGVIGMVNTIGDYKILYPEIKSFSDLGTISNYDGDWNIFFTVPEGATKIEIWDGDFDRGTSATDESSDTHDPDSPEYPYFADPAIVVKEGALGKGNPADNQPSSVIRREPAVIYEVMDPNGTPIFTNTNPTGTQEWENYIITTDATIPEDQRDVYIETLLPGLYTLHIKGLDLYNSVWVRMNNEIVATCGDKPCYIPPEEPEPPTPPECDEFGYSYADGYAIVALNPAECQGEKNGLLFHGTSNTYIVGDAISNGCLRTVGNTQVEMTDGLVYWVGDSFKEEDYPNFISPAPVHVDTPVTDWQIAKPNCDDPKAHHMDGKDFQGNVNLEPGLWCISGNVKINAQDTVTGTDVTLVMENGSWHTNGGAKVYLTAPFTTEDVSPAVNGVLFWASGEKQVDGNGEVCSVEGGCQRVTFNGNSQSYYQGVVYAPGSQIEVLGTGDVYAHRSQFIGWDVRVGGTAILKIDFRGNNLPACEQ